MILLRQMNAYIEMRKHMNKVVKRGFVPNDNKEFLGEGIEKLNKAAAEAAFLLERGYSVKTATTFVGNHHLLSERQRLALARGLAVKKVLEDRKRKEWDIFSLKDKKLYMDGFNTIITLEVAFSSSVIIKGEDETIRDLAGLRGTYQLIDKTEMALHCIFRALDKLEVAQLEIYLDSPVSNSGKLKSFILELAAQYRLEVLVHVIPDVDKTLYAKDGVITSDAIILDNCKSWVNLVPYLLREQEQIDYWIVEVARNKEKV